MPARNRSMYLETGGTSLAPLLNRPINGRVLVTWPRATSGHAAAAPPISVMNCRRFMVLPSRPKLHLTTSSRNLTPSSQTTAAGSGVTASCSDHLVGAEDKRLRKTDKQAVQSDFRQAINAHGHD